MHIIENQDRASGLTCRVVLDESGGTDCPLGDHDESVRLVTFSRRDGVYDTGVGGWGRRNERSPFNEPDDVLAWAKANRFIVYAVYKYEHGNVAYSVAPFSCQWDSGQAGYLLLSRKEWPRKGKKSDAYAKAAIEEFSAWANGEVYGFQVLDGNGEVLDSCWGFIGDSDYCMKEAESVAEYIERDRANKRRAKLKELIRSRAPLAKRESILGNINFESAMVAG